MNALEYAGSVVYPAAASILPTEMDSPPAKAMMLAIGLQESGFVARRQMMSGPARGFWEFEESGVTAVLGHPVTKPIITPILPSLVVAPWSILEAITYHDVLACILARLLLWTHPDRLPRQGESGIAWRQYLSLWRPGKPHPEVWEANFQRAWTEVLS